jgi:hypothetical protein
MTSRISHLRAVLLTAGLGTLGVLVLLFAAARPSIGRLLAGGLLLGAAAVVRYQDAHRNDPPREDSGGQWRSLAWTLAIIVVFIGVSVLLTHPWSD